MENSLKCLLKNSLAGARRIAILGIGSELRGDDIAGILAVDNISKKKITDKKVAVKVFNGSTAPENLTGEIKRFKPSHLVVIDTMGTGRKPGTILVVDPETIAGATFSTHTLPAKVLADYLEKSTHCKTIIIGIQARSVRFGDAVSKEVRTSARFISDSLTDTIKNLESKRGKNK